MFKSFYFKVLATFTIIVLVVIASLVSVQNYYYTSLYTKNVLDEMEEDARGISEKLGQYISNPGYANKTEYIKAMEFASNKYNAFIWLLDEEGNVFATKGGDNNFVGKQIPKGTVNEVLRPVFKGETVRTTEFFKTMKSEPVISICVPVKTGEKISGIVIVNARIAHLSSFTKTISQSMWTIPLMAFFIAGLFVVIASGFISRPLKELNKLAIEAGKGNFNYRYDINSQTEIAHIGENFNKMMSRLSKIEKFRSDFVQNASHELKAPITVISGYSQALKDSDLPEPKRQEYLDIILGETERMNGLIETLISLSKIESGNEVLNKEHFNINDVLSRNLLAFEFEIEKKNLGIEVNYESDTLEVCADKVKIEQVVINLLQNAIKYTGDGDKIIITTKQVKAKAYVEIMDTGIGIDKKELENIFDRFYTVDKAKTPGKSGSGIGLSLVKKILELHESEIMVESEKGEYTKFYFYLDM